MSIATLAELKAYTNVADGDAAGEALYQVYLDAADQVVTDYLGYAPAQASYSHSFFGDGRPYLQLRAPIVTLTSVTVDGATRSLADFIIEDEIITDRNGALFPEGSVVAVAYSGGFTSVPAAIKLATLRIAALMVSESRGNIGVNSVSMDGGNTRSFQNLKDYAPYLAPLASLRIVRLERKTKW